jgi:hypothetical protein
MSTLKFLRYRYTIPRSSKDLMDLGDAVRATLRTSLDVGQLERLESTIDEHTSFLASLMEKLHEKGLLSDDDAAALVDSVRATPEQLERVAAWERKPLA